MAYIRTPGYIFRQIRLTLNQLTKDVSPANVKLLRTSVRRLEARLALAFTEEKMAEHGKLLGRLDTLRKLAGKVRDLDVQIAALKSLAMGAVRMHRQQVMHELEDKRQKRERKLLKEIARTNDERFVKQMRRLQVEWSAAYQPAQGKLATAQAMLDDLVLEHKILAEHDLSKRNIHAFRLLAKQVRYTAELALTGTKKTDEEAERFVASMETVTDAIGDWHDWMTLEAAAAKVLASATHSPLTSALRNLTQAKLRAAIQTAADVTRQLATDSGGRKPLRRAVTGNEESAQSA